MAIEWRIAFGVFLGLAGFTLLEEWRERRQAQVALEQLNAAVGEVFSQPAVWTKKSPVARGDRGVRLARGERCEAGTVIFVSGRTAVQVLEGGRPVSCVGDYRSSR